MATTIGAPSSSNSEKFTIGPKESPLIYLWG
jgi:hypothetical protein